MTHQVSNFQNINLHTAPVQHKADRIERACPSFGGRGCLNPASKLRLRSMHRACSL